MKEHGTILVVDGVQDVRQLVQAYLDGQGYDLIFADGGAQALSKTERIPDLVLVGVEMPKALQVCVQLRSIPALSGTPVLMLADSNDRDARLLGVEAGADDIVSRPLDVVELRTRVSAMMRLSSYRRRVQELEGGCAGFELATALDATLESWGRALELRGVESEGHTARVTEMTAQLGRAMGLSEADLVHARRGAMLHDIGKMGIPDRIMFKVGPLDEDEWEMMYKHPVYAHDLLSPIEYLRPALDIPYYHHEKWDGSGYPKGLRGEEIPLTARIFAVVDVWDALHSDRSYRQAWNRSEVGDYIREQADKHFDRDVVHVLFDWLS